MDAECPSLRGHVEAATISRMMKLGALVLVMLAGCASETDRAWKAWSDAACAGDADAALAMVDDDALVSSLGPGGRAGWAEMRPLWEGELAKGKSGAICAWSKVGSDDTGEVVVKRASGDLSRLRFRAGKLVGYASVD